MACADLLAVCAKPSPRCSCAAVPACLQGLLTRDPTKRLGSGPGGSEAVRRHPFFKPISWAKLEARQLESKFKPEVTCRWGGAGCVGRHQLYHQLDWEKLRSFMAHSRRCRELGVLQTRL
jgi:hypothetical protein